MKPPPTNSPDFSPSSTLAEADRRAARRARTMAANLNAWAEVLAALGWCVALRLPDRPLFLSPAARRWLAERNADPACWESITAGLLAAESIAFLVSTTDLHVWRAAGNGQGAANDPPPRLTRREAEVLAWLRKGKTGPEIATILGCARRTVESHVARLYRKLGVNRRAQLLFQSECPETDAEP